MQRFVEAGRMVLRGLLATPVTLTPVLDELGRLVDCDARE
jgi:hypothetical protein